MKGVPKECKSRTTGCVFGTLGHCGQTKNPSNHQTNHGQGTPKCGCYVASLPMLRERPGCGGQGLALLWSKMSRPNMQHHFLGCAILPGSINPYPTAWAYWSLNKGCNLVIIILNWPMPNSTYPHMLSQYVTSPSRLYPLTATRSPQLVWPWITTRGQTGTCATWAVQSKWLWLHMQGAHEKQYSWW